MKKTLSRIFLSAILGALSSTSFAENLWDLRAVANQNTQTVNLYRTDRSLYTSVKVSDARMIRDILDKYSLQSGIYPTISLRESSEINASAGMVNGSPVMFINRPMLDVLNGDSGMTAALLGHEMAHLYLRHSDSSANNQAIGNAIALIAGIALEVLAERKLGVTNLGLNVGSAMGTVYVATFTREQERDADKQGIEWAIKSGYDPNGAIRLFSTFQNQFGNSLFTFTSTHPNPSERIENAKMTIASYSPQSQDIRVASNAPQQGQQTSSINSSLGRVQPYSTLSPTLAALNLKIDELRNSEAPKSEEARNGNLAFVKKDYAVAKSNFEKCSSRNEAICQNNLGVLYLNGLGVDIDKKKALNYFKLASDQKLSFGMTNYAAAIARGEDGVIDEAKIVSLILDASNMGSPAAMGTLAYMGQVKIQKSLQEKIPEPDVLLDYAKASAMRGFKDGEMALGNMYRTGYGSVNKDYKLAEQYLQSAAKKGDARAYAGLYLLYKRDLDDEAKADDIKNRILSTKQLATMGLIANAYCSENFITRNRSECVYWAKTGAYAGNINSARLYGAILYQGMGVDTDKMEGAAWVVYARNKGSQSAIQAVDENSSKFTPEEKSLIYKRVSEIESQIASNR